MGDEGVRQSDVERLEAAQLETTREIKLLATSNSEEISALTLAITDLVMSQKLQQKDNESIREGQVKLFESVRSSEERLTGFIEHFNDEYKPVINRSKWVQGAMSDFVKKYLLPAIVISALAAAGYSAYPGSQEKQTQQTQQSSG